MKRLFLLRHCEAVQFDEKANDHEKKLTKKGQKDAKLISQWFKKNNVSVDCILTSTALRTLETSKRIFKEQEKKIIENKNLYLCNRQVIIDILKMLDEKISEVILIGHEPSISECVNFFTLDTRPDLKNILNLPYPTGGLAVFYFNIKTWKELDEKTGILDAFISPSYLEKNEKQN